jgi:hypothetical protein
MVPKTSVFERRPCQENYAIPYAIDSLRREMLDLMATSDDLAVKAGHIMLKSFLGSR